MTKTCPYCTKTYTTQVCESCAEVFYPILNSLYKKQTNQQPALEDIDNLVFQGGGVLGITYLGCLKELGDSFLSKVKRIAGTSAGSMCALYLGLRKTEGELHDLIYEKNFANLLDDGVHLTVTWLQVMKLETTCKEVILAFINFMKEQSKTPDPRSAVEKAVDIITNIFSYLAGKISPGKGSYFQAFIEIFGPRLKKLIINLLERIFKSALQSESEQPDQIKANQESFREEVSKAYDKAESQAKLGVQSENMAKLTSGTNEDNLSNPKILCYAMVELVWTYYFHPDTVNSYVGFFNADKIKQELIIDPIAKSLKAIGSDIPAAEITFKELAEVIDKNTQQRAFRPIFITAHNTSTLTTEVFSPDHTPNVVVADAVRASMSIPIFFKTVTIKEKLPGQKPTELCSYTSPSDKGSPVLYVDGGLLDNYPLWIFDDLRYCVDGEIPNWHPQRRIEVQNPKSLGFRIMDKDSIANYTKPFYDDEQHKKKATNGAGGYKDYIDIGKFLGQIYSPFTAQENAFVQLDEVPRTMYIDGLDVNAVDFSLDNPTKDVLIGQGQQAVIGFKERAAKSFSGEIGGYNK